MSHKNLLSALLLTVVVTAGCAPTDVRSTRAASADQPLAKPERIVVYDFVIAPGDVRLNSGPGARVRRMLSSDPQSAEQTKVAGQVAKAFSEELVKAIGELGIPAERSAHLSRLPDRTLAVDGQFVSIDEGNRARRMVIGFGLGGTEVSAHVQVYLGTSTQQVLLQEFETKAESSKKPGAAVTMGAGAAVGGAAAIGGAASGALEFQASVEADARRTARKLAKQLEELFAQRGWIAAKPS